MDLVDRMIEWLCTQPDTTETTLHPTHPEVLIAQAVDEIERLRVQLEAAKDAVAEWREVAMEARAALKEDE